MTAIKGLVVCPQPRAADAGAAVLRQGGTAFDAALAAAFCQMVQDPFMCGIGGMGTLQFFDARSGRHGMIDFHTRAGSGVTPDMWAADSQGRSEISGYALFEDHRAELGYRAIMTPGTVAGFARFHETLCTMDWADLLAPAIAMAGEGMVVTPFFRDFLTRRPQPGLPSGKQRVTATPACAALYLNDQGNLHEVGETIRHTEMGATLDRIARHGAADFYTGETAARIAEDFSRNGAFVTASDLAGYRVVEGAPVIGTYRGYSIASNPPPGSGAVLIAMLNILENFDLAGTPAGSARHYDLVARAMAAAHEDREQWLADPAFAPVPVEDMMSKARAADWARRIRDGWLPGHRAGSPPSCTTHLSAWDAAGNCVSVTHTLGTRVGRRDTRPRLQLEQRDEAVPHAARAPEQHRGRQGAHHRHGADHRAEGWRALDGGGRARRQRHHLRRADHHRERDRLRHVGGRGGVLPAHPLRGRAGLLRGARAGRRGRCSARPRPRGAPFAHFLRPDHEPRARHPAARGQPHWWR
jgi:gamma-glutamyltranspeptidase/glutathione hydrolase